MYFFLFFILLGCASEPSLSIKSNPEGASVSALDSNGSEQDLGLTPVSLKAGIQSLNVQKEGFEPMKILISSDSSQNYEFNLRLVKKIEDPKLFDSKKNQEKLARNIAKANNLIHSKKYSEARNILENIVSDFPYISVSYDLLGNISYLQRDFKSAEQFYQKSIQISPDNVETQNVLERLKKITQQEVL
jgi:tetratricopeptide (TPR) repeat protein